MKNFKLAVLASALTISGSVLAASEGAFSSTGATTGSSVVSITKQDGVALVGVADLAFIAAASIDPVSANKGDDVCVFSSTGAYSVTATSTNDPAPASAFKLVNLGATTPIGYTVSWSANGGALVPLTNGTALAGQAGNNSDSTCPTPNARFEVDLSVVDFNAADPEDYQDTVSLLITSE